MERAEWAVGGWGEGGLGKRAHEGPFSVSAERPHQLVGVDCRTPARMPLEVEMGEPIRSVPRRAVVPEHVHPRPHSDRSRCPRSCRDGRNRTVSPFSARSHKVIPPRARSTFA